MTCAAPAVEELLLLRGAARQCDDRRTGVVGNLDRGQANPSRAKSDAESPWPEFDLMSPAAGWNRRPETSASAQDETRVTGVGGFLALLQVQRQPAGVDQHLALLARDVGAHVPGLRAREQSRGDQFGDMVAPGFFRFLCR